MAMDLEKRFELVKGVGEEIITEKELYELLRTKKHPVAYDGFEPSGVAGIHFGIFRALNIKDLLKAGIHFKLWLADWFAWINNKYGGDLDIIHRVGEYFVEVWKASGIDMKKVDVLWASEHMDKEYWKRVILIGKNTTVHRAERCLSIMGRKAGELKEVAQYFYPLMQASDIFHLKVDICQLGLDQRRANILAREVAPKLGLKRPVIVSHHMLVGLEGKKQPEGFDESKKRDESISSKMSKSKPKGCIYVHDSFEEIKKKINNAYCPPKIIEMNPLIDYSEHIILKAFKEMKIERSKKYGGDILFSNILDLKRTYSSGELHPLDLKNAVSQYLEKLVKPVRTHFEKNKRAKGLYEFVRKQEITR